MKQYMIKSTGQDSSLVQLLREAEGGYLVRIVHRHEGWEEVKEDFLSRDLLDTCLRTGYIAELSA